MDCGDGSGSGSGVMGDDSCSDPDKSGCIAERASIVQGGLLEAGSSGGRNGKKMFLACGKKDGTPED